jgi:lipoprotein NlpD
MSFHLTKNPILLIILASLVASCTAHKPHRAPIIEHGVEIRPSQTTGIPSAKQPTGTRVEPETEVIKPPAAVLSGYEVQKGDTLYSIAFAQGVDFHELVALNNIENPSAIQVGQRLQMPAANGAKNLPKKIALPAGTKSQPQALKVPYSDKALAQAEQQAGVTAPVAPKVVVDTEADDAEDAVDWAMPTSGKVIGGFSESANRKGVDIAGKTGQAVLASAAGKVVYSGNGLRGYGKLIIIKHNKVFLSAYAHNEKILVSEGQQVKKGQKIGEMGNSDADQVKLHFEIRKLGKPVDPVQYLPLLKP